MNTEDVFDLVQEVLRLEAEMRGSKLVFGDPKIALYNQIIRELDLYCRNFRVLDIVELYKYHANTVHFRVRKALEEEPP